jgi:phospholipid/cholesterol/gamma-HCH transport system ATP-binding protein
MSGPTTMLQVRELEMRFGERLIQNQISFEVAPGRIFAIMGGSGCGKSTLLKHLIGLIEPAGGEVLYDGVDYWRSDPAARTLVRAGFGVLFQSAALWSSMTVLENVLLPMQQQNQLNPRRTEAEQIERAREVLSWVGMAEFADYAPSDLSGGMKKRAGLARAVATEPRVLFLDEPSAGLDPISSRRLDDLILAIRERTGAAVLMVSHELPSLFAIADDGIFLDADSKHPIAHGCPRDLLKTSTHPTVQAFLNRTDPDAGKAGLGVPVSEVAST